MCHPRRFTHSRALVRDRASQFVNDFDEVFRTEGLKILKTPVRAPTANAFAERRIGTLRRELLDRTIIWNQRLGQTNWRRVRSHRQYLTCLADLEAAWAATAASSMSDRGAGSLWKWPNESSPLTRRAESIPLI